MSAPGEAAVAARTTARLTIGELWRELSAGGLSEELLDWAPDVAALTTVLLERSQAFRFVVSPPAGQAWPPPEDRSFGDTVVQAAAEWCTAMSRGVGGAPAVVRRLWQVVHEHLDTPLVDLATGRPWTLCQAVLTLHAVADEATAGCGGGGRSAGAPHLARARELLVRTGSLSRLPVDRVALLPKTRTTPVGMTHRSLSRYSCTTTTGIPAVWHRAPLRRLGGEPSSKHANVLLLPWPLHVRESDFRPVEGSVHRPEREPFGFFDYVPSEPCDLDLVDRLLEAAHDEVDRVDVVVLPEGALHEDEVAGLEAVLARHRTSLLVAGVRVPPAGPGRMPGNGVHIGVLLGDRWWHYRQNKHHRWFLDGGQVEQYNIAGALHPGVRWWEAMEIPLRSVNVLELGGGLTVAAVVCEDLARLDGVADLLRSVGPSLVVTLLLDGPQISSRWTARYAGVLADDPGSAVLTLTAFGMATRSRPPGLPPSNVISMWKDPRRGIREIPLEAGAQGVLLKVVQGGSPRYAADGRAPADDVADLYVAGVHQLSAGQEPRPAGGDHDAAATPPLDLPLDPPLDGADLSLLFSWAEAVAHALTRPDSHGGTLEEVLGDAAPGAPWRERLGAPEPSEPFAAAVDVLARVSRSIVGDRSATHPDVLLREIAAAERSGAPGGELELLVLRVLRASVDAARRG